MSSRILDSMGLRRAAALTAIVAALVGLVAWSPARAGVAALPLGDPDLTEARTARTLAPGVTLTTIVRGDQAASAGRIGTTTRGPWRVHVLTIDPARAKGHLTASYGPDLGQVESTTDLARLSGAMAGVNASFFAFGNPQYPGDPNGLGLYGGRLLSEPTANPHEADLVVDARSDRVLVGHLGWSGSVRNRQTGATLALQRLNHPPVVPDGCGDLDDPTECTLRGAAVRFDPAFSSSTPSGDGVEVVLDRRGCVLRTSAARGTTLESGQSSLQATGRKAASLLNLTRTGCLSEQVSLTDGDGRRLALRPGLFGVNGRYQLTAGGRIVVPAGSGGIFDRNPRTFAGAARDGRIMLVVIDGRQSTSVGTTLGETAAVAQALGMSDSVNLDGGGSVTMAVDGGLVNRPSDSIERAVGDALVYAEPAGP